MNSGHGESKATLSHPAPLGQPREVEEASQWLPDWQPSPQVLVPEEGVPTIEKVEVPLPEPLATGPKRGRPKGTTDAQKRSRRTREALMGDNVYLQKKGLKGNLCLASICACAKVCKEDASEWSEEDDLDVDFAQDECPLKFERDPSTQCDVASLADPDEDLDLHDSRNSKINSVAKLKFKSSLNLKRHFR